MSPVIPGRAKGASPETITTRSEAPLLLSSDAAKVVAMDSGRLASLGPGMTSAFSRAHSHFRTQITRTTDLSIAA